MNTNGNGKDNALQRDTVIRGIVTFKTALVFAGTLEGKLIGEPQSRLTITKDAKVRGEVQADEVRVEGTVSANVQARFLSLAGTGRINGDATFERLEIEQGGQLCGRVVTLPAREAKSPSSLKTETSPAPVASAA